MKRIYELWNYNSNNSFFVRVIIFYSFSFSSEWSKESALKSTEKGSSGGKFLITLLISQTNLQMTLKFLVTLQYY